MTGRDDPPAEAVEAMAVRLRHSLLWACAKGAPATKSLLVECRTLPAAARWRLIGWLAEGLEPTQGMMEAGDDQRQQNLATREVLRAALTTAREASDECPVRVALLAATTEAETWQRDAAGRRRICPADAMERMTAAAVAAFLRGMADQCDGGSVTLDCGQSCGPHTMHDTLPLLWIAAAVERAAREAGE